MDKDLRPALHKLVAEVNEHMRVSIEDRAHPLIKGAHPQLRAVIGYMLNNGGKRLRPLFVLASASAARADWPWAQKKKAAWPAVLAVEYVHTFSLIHDDLPAMDDDDMRRNKPSCHRQFGEALALLAGDALLADAFYVLSFAKHNALLQCRELSLTAGRFGLISGQVADLNPSAPEQWLDMYRQKTARLFEASCKLGALSVEAKPPVVEALGQLGDHLGLAFQMIDDLQDSSPICSRLGPKALGSLAHTHCFKAQELLQELPGDTQLLEEILSYFLHELDANVSQHI